MVTMSQKSSDPQAVKSVSQVLMPDNRRDFRCLIHMDLPPSPGPDVRLPQPAGRMYRIQGLFFAFSALNLAGDAVSFLCKAPGRHGAPLAHN
jgi:hypothetical protein